MITESRYSCKKCGKSFVTKGRWHNQFFIEQWHDMKFIMHCIRHHRENLKIRDYAMVAKRIVILMVLILLSVVLGVIWIITLPFSLIHDAIAM